MITNKYVAKILSNIESYELKNEYIKTTLTTGSVEPMQFIFKCLDLILFL